MFQLLAEAYIKTEQCHQRAELGGGATFGGKHDSSPIRFHVKSAIFKMFLVKQNGHFKLLRMAYIDSLLPVDNEHYFRKWDTIGIYCCPYIIMDRKMTTIIEERGLKSLVYPQKQFKNAYNTFFKYITPFKLRSNSV